MPTPEALAALSQPGFVAPGDVTVVGDLAIRGGSPWVDVKARGAKGDGATDDADAIAEAIAALPSSGGRVFFPPGTYVCSSFPSLAQTQSVILEGAGGTSSGQPAASRIVYSGTGSGSFVDARSSYGLKVRDLMIVHSSPLFTGDLFDLSHYPSQGDAAYFVFENVYFGGQGIQTATAAKLENAIVGAFRDCNFVNLNRAIQGRFSDAAYSNVMSFENCIFAGHADYPIYNPGQAWKFDNCTFEPLTNGACGAISIENGNTAWQLVIDGGWFGDASVAGNPWFKNRGTIYGLEVNGAFVYGVGSTVPLFSLGGDTTGSVFGVSFTGMKPSGGVFVEAPSGGSFLYGLAITGCDFGSIATVVTNTGNVIVGSILGCGETPNKIFGAQSSLAVGPTSLSAPTNGLIVNGEIRSEGIVRAGYGATAGLALGGRYTTATRPSASGNDGMMIYVSDAAAGSKLQYSDGSSWIAAG